MAQIDHEEGNQSGLEEVFTQIFIPPPLKKKVLTSNHVRVQRDQGRAQRYIKTRGFSAALITYCSDNNISSVQA